jgi:hypothetical protein
MKSRTVTIPINWEKLQLALTFALPHRASTPGKYTDEERQDGNEKTESCCVDRPGTVKREPDDKRDSQ